MKLCHAKFAGTLRGGFPKLSKNGPKCENTFYRHPLAPFGLAVRLGGCGLGSKLYLRFTGGYQDL